MANKSELSFTCVLTRKDHLELLRASSMRYALLVLYLVAAIYCLLAFNVFWVSGYTQESSFAILEYLAISLFAILVAMVVPYLRSRLLSRGPLAGKSRTYSIDEHGIEYKSQFVTGTCQWASFALIKETKLAFVFFFSPLAALLIPKHCLPANEDINTLRQIISTHFQGKKRLRS